MSEKLRDKTVLVMGLGKFGGGADAALYASKFAQKVTVTDLSNRDSLPQADALEAKDIQLVLGEHRESDFTECDVLIVNPAIAEDNRFVRKAEESGALVTSSIALFFQQCKGKIVGVTGSNGKSTTTSLIYHLLFYASKQNCIEGNVFLSGNIGNLPLLEILAQIGENDIAVLEISSFQAEQLDKFGLGPWAAVITNLTPNHLDRHGTFQNYCNAKKKLFLNQPEDGVSFLNRDDEVSAGWFEELKNTRKTVLYSSKSLPAEMIEKFNLPGEANKSNLAAAAAAAEELGIDRQTLSLALPSFKALPHRLQLTAEKNGVRWYNDSISTTPESTIAGAEAFSNPVILIAGGYDKKIPFDKMARVVSKRIKYAVLIGDTAEKIKELIESSPKNQCRVYLAGSLENACLKAWEKAEAGDNILLSPACASYDMFESFKQRGEIFTELAERITGND
ncbi:UDP-N-acetylmuramoylalanine--D-glutamate ligase [Sedimentisphaera cyanobacteriorum]|uniref:UDP-N-acetylmuramoylalanine--D-glutamate ligase n=1 Tax=Sedimentisphaera cyanobacteriorum TaxID=1940790 RepID=A0A1Q2HN07_9BACT|nr:UDP-N-acetylmuramoyl-L-alanine--D-glutamate ligase [Sedimentisphaera cyanobacteriorum]AQQ08818.1 UDP-N-acetylmuramoylalanine--D-glutamate ligase [Sedimentisphaera cyanobacteriorum]